MRPKLHNRVPTKMATEQKLQLAGHANCTHPNMKTKRDDIINGQTDRLISSSAT